MEIGIVIITVVGVVAMTAVAIYTISIMKRIYDDSKK